MLARDRVRLSRSFSVAAAREMDGLMAKRSGHEHRSASDRSARNPLKGEVAVGQWMHLDIRPHRYAGGELDELAGIPARDVRDATDGALPPEQVVGELGYAIQVDRVDGDGAASLERTQRRDDDVADGRERDRAVSGSGGVSSYPPAQTAPSSRARCFSASERVQTWTRQPQCTAT